MGRQRAHVVRPGRPGRARAGGCVSRGVRRSQLRTQEGPGPSAEALVNLTFTVGDVLVGAHSNVPEDQVVAAMASLGRIDLASQPVREGVAAGAPPRTGQGARLHRSRDGQGHPLRVYDLGGDEGWVSVGDDADTAGFAVTTVRRWWAQMDRARYPGPPASCAPTPAGRTATGCERGRSNWPSWRLRPAWRSPC